MKGVKSCLHAKTILATWIHADMFDVRVKLFVFVLLMNVLTKLNRRKHTFELLVMRFLLVNWNNLRMKSELKKLRINLLPKIENELIKCKQV